VGDLDHAVQAVKQGAFHFITRQIDLDQVRSLVSHAIERQTLNREVLRLRTEVEEDASDKHFIEGPSKATHEILDTVQRVVGLSATVLILGESGTGK